ncbi:hypothetical protein NPIL_518591 [Nephila pilipes]|uniref:Uncharacterized protein n=1 Tax=Nephila pilipes TaxID=299642 RepID=A0A8X6UTA0_NEPPI|nr:hypothetical protein NPIL_518591 [Nephila pilipes]
MLPNHLLSSECSTCPPPQGITHCRCVTNPATAECRMSGCIHNSSRWIAYFNWMDGIDTPGILNIPTAKSLLVSDLETEQAMETCNVC